MFAIVREPIANPIANPIAEVRGAVEIDLEGGCEFREGSSPKCNTKWDVPR